MIEKFLIASERVWIRKGDERYAAVESQLAPLAKSGSCWYGHGDRVGAPILYQCLSRCPGSVCSVRLILRTETVVQLSLMLMVSDLQWSWVVMTIIYEVVEASFGITKH